MDRYDIETVKQVLAKPPVGDHFVRVQVARGNQSKIRSDHRIAADPLKFLVFQNAQQFGLHLERHVADLVQKSGTVEGEFEFFRFAAGSGSGKGALLVSEQFRFDEISSKSASLFFSDSASGG